MSPMIAATHDPAGALATSAATEILQQFNAWLEDAMRHGVPTPKAMSLATVDATGSPSVRIVDLNYADERGFVFFTNLRSSKAGDLAAHPRAALCFHWKEIGRQVRLAGRTEPVTDAEAEAEFAARPRLKQIGAWASRQSQPMAGSLELEQACAAVGLRYALGPVPRPAFWSGYRVVPDRVEFWRQVPLDRVERVLHSQAGGRWVTQRLYP